MKPQDLRIGNYVRIKATDVIVQICAIVTKVCGIMENVVVVRYKDKGEPMLEEYGYDMIEPVLIREVYTLLPSIPNLTWNDWVESGNLYQYGNIPIKYLHELQNIHYALTGNEIEIEI